MDRKICLGRFGHTKRVALRKESVDRKRGGERERKPALFVALRKESVDRKFLHWLWLALNASSLSARRAWIEKRYEGLKLYLFWGVALRKESVDRKRDWHFEVVNEATVALRKESVDRKYPFSTCYR